MIVAKKLSKNFGSIRALDNLNFCLKNGDVVALLGPNGAGKTTLLRLLTGYLLPSEGNVEIYGHDPRFQRVEALSKIGYVPENAPLYPEMTVFEFIKYAADLRHLGGEAFLAALREASAQMRLNDVMTQKIETLSKGFKHRVAIAAALIHQPRILILDEPTSALDPQGRAEVMSIIKNLADMGTTIILCTHILSDVERTANRIGIVRDGRMAVEGTISEIKEQYDKAGKKIVMGIFGDPSAAIQPVSTLTGGNFYFDRQRAVFEIPIASDINEQETAHRLFDLLNSAGLTVSLFVIENKTLEQIYMETIG